MTYEFFHSHYITATHSSIQAFSFEISSHLARAKNTLYTANYRNRVWHSETCLAKPSTWSWNSIISKIQSFRLLSCAIHCLALHLYFSKILHSQKRLVQPFGHLSHPSSCSTCYSQSLYPSRMLSRSKTWTSTSCSIFEPWCTGHDHVLTFMKWQRCQHKSMQKY